MIGGLIRLHDALPPDWEARCHASAALFHSAGWQTVLADGLGCRSLYASTSAGSDGTVFNVFPAGPFRIGYGAYPVGGTLMGGAISNAMLSVVDWRDGPVSLDLLRIPVSGFGTQGDLSLDSADVPETAIMNLGAWRPDVLPAAVRRNLRRSASCGLVLDVARSEDIASDIYRLYAATIRRHDGSRRYGLAYFKALLRLAACDHRISVMVARDGEQVAGFLIVALHGQVAFYLHGAMDPACSNKRPSEALFSAAISWSQAQGAECFNMMSSPPGQPSLVRFKEKWGGITRIHRTHQMKLRPWRASAFRFAERMLRRMR